MYVYISVIVIRPFQRTTIDLYAEVYESEFSMETPYFIIIYIYFHIEKWILYRKKNPIYSNIRTLILSSSIAYVYRNDKFRAGIHKNRIFSYFPRLSSSRDIWCDCVSLLFVLFFSSLPPYIHIRNTACA